MAQRVSLTVIIVVMSLLAACGDGDSAGTDGGPAVDAGAGAPDARGDAGSAPDAAPPDIQARIRLLNQEVFREDDVFPSGGTGALYFFDPQPLPADGRESWLTDDGERCTYESGTEWPVLLPGGVEWPTGPFFDAGDLEFDVTGAANRIIFEFYDTAYIRKAPAALQQGSWTHNSFFDAANLPPGQPFTMTALGGTDVGFFTISGASLPDDFTVTSPDLEGGTTVVSVVAPLPVSWSPAQPGATFWLLVKDAFGFVLCELDDDGSATIPTEVMSKVIGGGFNRVTVQAWRDLIQTVTVEDNMGQQIQIELVARHAQIGRFDTSN